MSVPQITAPFIFALVAIAVSANSALADIETPRQEAQIAQAQTLETVWTDATGFAYFDWLRAEDNRELYSSSLYLSVSGNTLSIYNTYNAEPLGRLARCGGLGCDLGTGSLVATLEFVQQGSNLFTVQSASSRASFLQGAQCRIVGNVLQALECFSEQGPSADMPSVFRFSPGT